MDFLKKTWISLFSVLVVRSREERESALLLQRLRERVKATTGSLSCLFSMCTSDSHTFFSLVCYIMFKNRNNVCIHM